MGKLKQFEIQLDSEHGVFYPGNVIKGKCVLELKADVRIRAIRVDIRGSSKVHLRETRHATGNLAFHAENINSELVYFCKRKVLFASETRPEADQVFDKGVHEFEFTFVLPSSGLSTSIECKYGNVRYFLKGEVEIPWSFNYRTKKAFTVICPIDINRAEYQAPVVRDVDKTFCCFMCTPGQISLKAHTDRSGYCPGESIVIKADFENNTNRTVVPHAVLKQTQVFNAGGKIFKRNVKLTTVTGLEIKGHKQANWDGQLLKIPPVPPSIVECRLVGIEYHVSLALYIPFVGLKSFLSLPIVIGTVPYRARRSRISSSLSTRPPPPPPPPPPPQQQQQQLPLLNRTRLPPMIAATPSGHNWRINSVDEDVRSSITPPPTYTECINGSGDIGDDEEDELMGDTSFTPRYAYAPDGSRNFCPPPAYSERDPFPI